MSDCRRWPEEQQSPQDLEWTWPRCEERLTGMGLYSQHWCIPHEYKVWVNEGASISESVWHTIPPRKGET